MQLWSGQQVTTRARHRAVGRDARCAWSRSSLSPTVVVNRQFPFLGVIGATCLTLEVRQLRAGPPIICHEVERPFTIEGFDRLEYKQGFHIYGSLAEWDLLGWRTF